MSKREGEALASPPKRPDVDADCIVPVMFSTVCSYDNYAVVARFPKAEWDAWKLEEGKLCEDQGTPHSMYAMIESALHDGSLAEWQEAGKKTYPSVIRVMNAVYGLSLAESIEDLEKAGLLLPLHGGLHCNTFG